MGASRLTIGRSVRIRIRCATLSFSYLPIEEVSDRDFFLSVNFCRILRFKNSHLVSLLEGREVSSGNHITSLLFTPREQNVFVFELVFLRSGTPFVPFRWGRGENEGQVTTNHDSAKVSPQPVLVNTPHGTLETFGTKISLSYLYVFTRELPRLFHNLILSLTYLMKIPSYKLTAKS